MRLVNSIEAEKIVIVGTGGFAREVAWLISENQFEKVIGFVTDDTEMYGETLCNLPVLGPKSWLYSHQDVYVVVAIGDPRARAKVTRELEANHVKFTSVDHNTCLLYTSDAADEEDSVDLGGRRIIKKKKKKTKQEK